MTYHNGWDVFHKPLGTCDSMACKVCNSEMEKITDRSARSYAEAMSILQPNTESTQEIQIHDVFRCLFSEEEWHQQVYRLMIESRETASKWLRDKLQEEVEQIVKTRECTNKEL